MRVLVTGATGFIGPKVANAVIASGHEVRVLERNPGSAARRGVAAAEAVRGDMTDSASLGLATAGMDVVVHLVAIRQGSPDAFERVMIEGTRNLIAAAKQAGVRRFVLMSALGTTAETKDLVPYFNAKWTQEQDMKASELEHVIIRPSFVFGRDGGILPTFMRMARIAPVTAIVGSGEQRIQPIWIEDLASYFAQAVDAEQGANRTFELGGPDVVSWNELWRRIRTVLGIRRRPTLHLPTALMRIPALVTERLPGNIPLTRDLLTMLEAGDNVVSNDEAVRTFQTPLVSLDEQLRRAA